MPAAKGSARTPLGPKCERQGYIFFKAKNVELLQERLGTKFKKAECKINSRNLPLQFD